MPRVKLSGEERAFWDQIVSDPLDVLVRRVYADWLRDHDDPRADAWDAIAKWRLYPCYTPGSVFWNIEHYKSYYSIVIGERLWVGNDCAPAMLPGPWFRAVHTRHSDGHLVRFCDRYQAYRGIVDAYLKLSPDDRSSLVGCALPTGGS